MVTALPDDPTKVFGRRVVAAIIDGLLLLVPTIAILSSQFEYVRQPNTDAATEYCDDFTDRFDGGVCFAWTDRAYFDEDGVSGLTPVGLALGFALHVLLQGVTGWTIGKRIMGIRCVQADGSPPGFGKALGRWVLLLVNGQPCGVPLVGFITGLTTTGHRRVGDMAAKTFVVRAAAAGSWIVVPGLTTAPAGAPPPPGSPPPPGAPWTAGSAIPPPPPVAHPEPTAKEGPQWDEQRGTYIQWDPELSLWMQWDDDAKAWNPIPNQ